MAPETHDSDFLDGADAIAAFLGTTRRRAFYLLQRKQIPAAKIGDDNVQDLSHICRARRLLSR